MEIFSNIFYKCLSNIMQNKSMQYLFFLIIYVINNIINKTYMYIYFFKDKNLCKYRKMLYVCIKYYI